MRITPAYAGKSGINQFWYSRVEDHPRVCGEKRENVPMEEWLKGSPPRMRGKAAGGRDHPPPVGITPAYAGKSQCKCALICVGEDHPRVCGEKRSVESTSAYV